MSSSERLVGQRETLHRQFAQLREQIHRSMKREQEVRLRENPKPTKEEIYMGVFKEDLEPQVRDAIREMYRKGYATQSSGFDGLECERQQIDGYFIIDEKTKDVLQEMGVEVLRGADIGLPMNKLVRILRFRAPDPAIDKIKAQWDAVAAALPMLTHPPGFRPISDRAEEFRAEYAPEYPSLDEARAKYFEYIRKSAE